MAASRDISIYQGDSYTHEARIRNSSNVAINISGRTYTAQIKRSKGSDSVVASFTTSITDAANGVLTFSMTSSNTANISSGTYYYDLEEVNGSTVTTLMGGKVTVVGDISNG
jgi:hypothetical protein